MPNIVRAIANTERTITRPICLFIANDFLRKTGFNREYTPLFTNEATGATAQLKNAYNSNLNNPIRGPYDTYLYLDVKEIFTQDSVVRNTWQINKMPLTFNDSAHGIYIRPYYTQCQLSLNMKLRSSSRVALDVWLEQIRLAHQVSKIVYFHDIPYQFDIPNEYLVFLGDAFTQCATVDSELTDLGDWLKTCFKTGIQKRQSQSGGFTELFMGEVQHYVSAKVTDEFFYNSSKEISDNMYEVSIPYELEYQKPIGVRLTVPGTLGNATLADKYVQAWVPKINRTLTTGEFMPFYLKSLYTQSYTNDFYLGDGGARLREWDDWFPQNYSKNYQTICISPVQVDPDHLKTIGPIDDFPDDYLPAGCKSNLKGVPDKMRKIPFSLIGVEFYELYNGENRVHVNIDDEGNMTTVTDMDPKKRYYLRFSLLKDLSTYHSYYARQLISDPELAMSVFKLYDDTVTLTNDYETWRAAMPKDLELKQGGYPSIESLLYAPVGGAITALSYTYWLRKLACVNTLFKMLTPHAYGLVLTEKVKALRLGAR